MHLGNLPASGFRELEVVCAGLRFGKVEHYAVLSNKHRVKSGNSQRFPGKKGGLGAKSGLSGEKNGVWEECGGWNSRGFYGGKDTGNGF